MISLNKKALQQLKNTKHKDLMIIPKADHLFDEEEGIMEKVGIMTRQWFDKNFINLER